MKVKLCTEQVTDKDKIVLTFNFLIKIYFVNISEIKLNLY